MDYNEMTNSELKAAKRELEDEYEAIKAEILQKTERLKELDREFVEADKVLKSRSIF